MDIVVLIRTTPFTQNIFIFLIVVCYFYFKQNKFHARKLRKKKSFLSRKPNVGRMKGATRSESLRRDANELSKLHTTRFLVECSAFFEYMGNEAGMRRMRRVPAVSLFIRMHSVITNIPTYRWHWPSMLAAMSDSQSQKIIRRKRNSYTM